MISTISQLSTIRQSTSNPRLLIYKSTIRPQSQKSTIDIPIFQFWIRFLLINIYIKIKILKPSLSTYPIINVNPKFRINSNEPTISTTQIRTFNSRSQIFVLHSLILTQIFKISLSSINIVQSFIESNNLKSKSTKNQNRTVSSKIVFKKRIQESVKIEII